MSVLLATPCYGGMLTVASFYSIMGAVSRCSHEGIDINVMAVGNESAITRGRSNIAASFLRLGYETLAMIDADIEIDPADFMKLLVLKKDIRGAAVNTKTEDHSESLSCYKDGKQAVRAEMPSEPFEVDYLGGAVMFIERHVIEKLSEIEMLQYVDPINGPGAHLFWERIVDGALLSEDYAFCSLAREHGFKVFCEPSVIVSHYGPGVWCA